MKSFSRNTSITLKLGIICIIFALPIAVLLYYVISGYNQHINFAKKEIAGTKLIEPLAKFSRSINENQFFCMSKIRFDSSSEIENNIKASQDDADSALSSFYENLKSGQDDFQLSYSNSLSHKEIFPEAIKADWEIIKSKDYSKDLNVFFRNNQEIIERVNKLIRLIAEESNLLLDPDLDSYCLMDIALLQMPELCKHTNSVFSAGMSSLLQEPLSELSSFQSQSQYKQSSKELQLISFHISEIKNEALDNINNLLKTAKNEDKNFYGIYLPLQEKLENVFVEYENSLIGFFSLTENNLIAREASDSTIHNDSSNNIQNSNEKLRRYENEGLNAIDKENKFWLATISQLGELLALRKAEYIEARNYALGISIGAMLLAFVFSILILNRITKPLLLVTKIIIEIASGNIQAAYKLIEAAQATKMFAGVKSVKDLSDFKDEIYKLFLSAAKMTTSLNKLLINVTITARQVSISASVITELAKNLEASVAEQVASTSETVTISMQIRAVSQELSGTMDDVSNKAQDSSDAAHKGLEGVEGIRVAISTLLNSVAIIHEKLELITQRSANISKVINTITKVANQTNLLSLNAAIEAENLNATFNRESSRTTETSSESTENYGAGFSVVAIEIRKLADETSVAALNIESLLNEMHETVDQGSRSVDDFAEQMQKGSAKIAAISLELEDIIEKMQDLISQFSLINEAMKMQADSTKQIEETMEQLNSVSIQTRNSLVDFNFATGNLKNASATLQEELSHFIVEEKKENNEQVR